MKKLLTTVFIALLSFQTFAEGPDDPLYTKVTLDNFEFQDNEGDALNWDANVWIGHDRNKLYFYTEGEKEKGTSAGSENQLVFSKALSTFWDIQYGLGYDKTENADKTWGVVSLQGLAPYFFETRTALLVGDNGDLGLRLSFEYEALFTQRLILTPSFEADLYSKDIPEMGLGSGLSSLVVGARLRYEIRREFAPYIGIEWTKNFGNTNKFSQLNDTYAVAGIRIWF